jgi:hypothetical protein
MTVRYYPEIEQGSEEWRQLRCGILTASEMNRILTPKLKVADNAESRTHLYELLAQRITGYVEPRYISDDMLRGQEDEVEARILYDRNFEPLEDVGFISNDRLGFTIGYSPDGLVGKYGAVECKSRLQKYQVKTILDGAVPDEFVIQLQTGLLVSEREWIDFLSYSAGLPMIAIRVYPDAAVQEAIVLAATLFEETLRAKASVYGEKVSSPDGRLLPTKRKAFEEIYL